MLKQRNSKKQGDVGLGHAIAYFASQGYDVLLPLTDSQDYDLVIDNGILLMRVQVKTVTYTKSGNYSVDLRTKGGNKSGTGKVKYIDFDRVAYLFVLTGDGSMYLIPTSTLSVKSSITLCDKYEQYKLG